MYSNFFKQSVSLRGLVIAAAFAAVPAMANACPDADRSGTELSPTTSTTVLVRTLWRGVTLIRLRVA
jgi:hypothetical protein